MREETARLFYALWPDDGTRASLVQLQDRVRGRLSAAANLHLTLAFLGDQPVSRLSELRSLMQDLPQSPIDLSIDRFGHFNRARIAWAGMSETPPALDALHQRLRELLLDATVPFDDAPHFRPHITLARNASAPGDTSFQPIRWHASRLALAHSISGDKGVEYRIVGEIALRDM